MKILRVRLDAELGEGLDRLKTERLGPILDPPGPGRATGDGWRIGGDSPAACSRGSRSPGGDGVGVGSGPGARHPPVGVVFLLVGEPKLGVSKRAHPVGNL